MKNMKKLITLSMLAILVIPTLSLAKQYGAWADSPTVKAGKNGNRPLNVLRKLSRTITGQIVSVSTDSVTIASKSKAEDQPKEIQVRIHEKYADEFTELLGQGLGKQAQLLCISRIPGEAILFKIKSIEGVDVSDQPDIGSEVKERLRERFRPNDGQPGQRGFAPHMMQPGMMPQPGRDIGKRRGGFAALRQDPELRNLERETHELAKECKKAKGQEREEIEDKLRGKLSETFDKKTELQYEAVEQMESQLDKLRQRLETRKQNGEAIIQRRFEQLTKQEDDLAW